MPSVMLIRSVSYEKQPLQNRGLLQILKKIILKQRGFQFLSGRGINDTNVRKFQQNFIGIIFKENPSKLNFEK